MGLFALSCCVAFYSTTNTTGAWPCGENGCFLVSYIFPFSVQHIPASKTRFLMHPDEGESQKVSVKQYESYNRGLALSDPSWLLIGWRTWSHPSHWLGPGCSLLLLQGLHQPQGRKSGTWPRGIPRAWSHCAVSDLEGDLSAGRVAPPSHLQVDAKNCFLLIGWL